MSKFVPQKHNRRSIRLKGYDYSKAGAYFVTICTYGKECIFGKVIEGESNLSPIDEVVNSFWKEIPDHFENAGLDAFVVMPNHIHGILLLHENVGVQNFEPLQRQHKFQHTIPKSVGSIIRSYKATVTRWCRSNEHTYFKWQRNYYEHIIRDEKSLNRIREYIQTNPIRWHLDKENPNSTCEDDLDRWFKNRFKKR